MKNLSLLLLLLIIPVSTYAAPDWEGPYTIKSINVQAGSTPTILINIKESAATFSIQVGQLGVDADEIKMLLSVLLTAQSTGASFTIHCEQSGTKYTDIVSILSP